MSMRADQTVAVMGRRFDSTRPVFFEAMAGTTLETVVEEAVGRLRRDRVYTPAQARSLLRYARCRVDGVEIPRKRWAETRPVPGARIEVLRTVRGGGGGGGKSPVGMIAAIAVMAVASYAAPAILGALGGVEAGFVGPLAAGQFYISSWMTAAVTGGLMMVGSYVTGALFGQAAPSISSSTYDAGSESPTYSITGARNSANLYGYVPLVLGTHRHTPPLGAKSWTVWEGEDQFFNMLVVWGHKDIVVSDFRIDETSLDEFTDVTHEFHQATTGDDLTLFAKSYNEQSVGALLSEESGWVTRTIGEAEAICCDIAFQSGLTEISTSDGSRGNCTVQFEAQYREVGTSTWIDSGLGAISATRAQSTPAVESFRIDDLARADYEMRIRRTTADSDSQYIYDEATWSVSRAILNQAAFNTPVPICVSELRIKANDQLSGYVDDFNALCSSNLPSWDGTGWETVAETANPADQMRYLLTTRSGMAKPYTETKMDDTTLAELAEWCAAQGHEFNYVCDSETRVWERLTQILSAGRAAVTTDVDGLWGATIDQPGKTIKQLFTPRNSWGCKIKRGFMELPHALRVSYVDEDDDYETKEGFVYADGYDEDNAVDIVSWDYPGVTNWGAIWKMGRRHLAKILHRQLGITLSTDWEWLAAHRGALVGVASDVLMNVFGSARILRLLFDIGEDALAEMGDEIPDSWIVFDNGEVLVGRAEDIPLGEDDEPLVPVGVQIDDTVIFSDPAPARYGIAIRDNTSRLTTYEIAPEYGEENDVLRFSYVITSKPSPQLGALCSVSILGEEYDEYLVSAITPGQNLTAELTLIPSAMDEIEASVSGEIPAYAPPVRLDVTRGTTLPVPTITNVRSDEGVLVRGADGTLVSRIMVNYSLGTGAVLPSTVQAQYRRDGDVGWTSAPSVIAGDPVIITGVEDGSVYDIRVRAVTVAGVASGWVEELGHTVVGKSSNPSDVSVFALAAADSGITATWGQVADLDVARYEIRATDSGWGDGNEIASGAGSTVPLPMAAAGTHTYYIRALDTTGHYSSASASASITVTAPGLTGLAADYLTASVRQGSVVQLSWTGVQASYSISGYQVRRGPTWATATAMGEVDATRAQYPVDWGGTQTWWVAAVDAYGNVGTPVSIDAVVVLPSASALTLQVIDNSVLMRWTGAAGSLPIAGYNVYRGAVDEDHLVGTADTTFTVVDETASGTFQYFIEPVDAAGNTGTTASATTTVDEPPDFVLYAEFEGDFDTATMSNIHTMTTGQLLLPVNTTETWAEHFSNTGATSIQDLIDAGYTYWCEPNPSVATYQEDYDAGAVIAGCRIVADIDLTTLDDGVTVTPQIYTKEASGDAWTTQAAGQWEVYATDFRYARLLVTFAASDDASQAVVSAVSVSLRVKRAVDSGTVSITSQGQTVAFNNVYLDAEQPVVTPGGTTPLVAVADFADVPNPTGFDVYLFNLDGTAATLPVTIGWTTRGVIQGG
jgi:hypothetical protein